MKFSLWPQAMGRWQREALTEGPMARRRSPSTIAYGDGPPPHRFATGRIIVHSSNGLAVLPAMIAAIPPTSRQQDKIASDGCSDNSP